MAKGDQLITPVKIKGQKKEGETTVDGGSSEEVSDTVRKVPVKRQRRNKGYGEESPTDQELSNIEWPSCG